MKIKHILLTSIVYCLSLGLHAQSENQKDYSSYPYWQEMMLDNSVNFFETQKAFYEYWENRTPTRGKGYKIFKRWEYWSLPRISDTGEFPQAGYYFNEQQNYIQNHPATSRLKTGMAEWKELGPKTRVNYGGYVGVGRVNAISFHPTDTATVYIGAPNGGFWYSHDDGASWASSTDKLATLGVSAIISHPERTDEILIGTGDRDGNDDPGLGVFKSTDGGLSWAESSEGMDNITVGMFAPSPVNPELIYAAGNGGFYKTTDFGENWTKLVSNNNNYRDVKLCPGNDQIIYTYNNQEGISVSNDGGENWTDIGADQGLTGSGRKVIAVTPANDSLVYILTGSEEYDGVFISRDFGQTFTLQSDSPNILGWSYEADDDGSQAWYDLIIHVDPVNENLVHIGGINLWKSSNGGKDWQITGHWWGDRTNAVHADQHYFGFNPLNNRLYVGNDGGVYWTDNQGGTWTEISEGLGIGQMYKLGVSLTDRNKVITGFQDNGTATLMGTEWLNTGGGDGMECAIDPYNASYSYSTLYYGSITRRINNSAGKTVAGEGTFGIDEKGGWVTPFIIGERLPNTMVVGMKNVWLSRNIKSNGDIKWTKISDNLADRNDVNGRVLEHCPANTDLLYYVRADNKLFRTNNLLNNPTWKDLTSQLPSGGSVNDLECHPYDENTVYMTKGNKVYVSNDKGMNWDDISGSLPEIPVLNICYDKTSLEGLYISTITGVYYRNATMDDWELHGTGLPFNAKANEIEIYYDRFDRSESRLRVCTFGRGMWEVGLAEGTSILPPFQLIAVAETGIVDLTWQPPFYEENVVGYNVYRNDELIASPASSSYLDRDVENEVTYNYYVTAIYADSKESAPSNNASATPLEDIILPYNQDFEKGNAGWNAKFTFDGWEYGTSEELKVTGNDGHFFGINSGMAGEGFHVIDTLFTPKIDLSPYAGQIVTMKFRYTLRKYMDFDHLFLAYKEPAGNRWNIVEEIEKPSGFGWPWGEMEMELPSDWLVEDLQIGFLYDDSNEHGWGAGIDDFQLLINTSSIFDLELASKLNILPNPSNGNFTIQLNDPETGELTMQILDINGRLVFQKAFDNNSGSVQENIDLTGKAKGIYTLIIKNGASEHRTKLTIQ